MDLGPKQLELLRSMVPKLSSVCLLLNPANPSIPLYLKSVQAAAQKLGLKVLLLEAGTPEAIEKAFSVMTEQKAGAVIIPLDGLFSQQRNRIAELAAKHRLPSISSAKENVEAGGLMSYGQNRGEGMFRTAAYVDKIFKGANPGDLPVEQPIKVELVINAKSAKALGLAVPQSLLISADKVIPTGLSRGRGGHDLPGRPRSG